MSSAKWRPFCLGRDKGVTVGDEALLYITAADDWPSSFLPYNQLHTMHAQ